MDMEKWFFNLESTNTENETIQESRMARIRTSVVEASSPLTVFPDTDDGFRHSTSLASVYPARLFRRAHAISPHAVALLPACRDIPSAVTELRWIRSHVASNPASAAATTNGRRSPSKVLSGQDEEARVARLCAKRGRGVPLQYVLGSQPFGALDIKCRPGVLAPRAETEAYALHLTEMITRGRLPGFESRELRVVDFCTGTGCIALSLYERLTPWAKKLSITGVDVSPVAVNLSRENLRRNVAAGCLIPPALGKEVSFRKADVFQETDMQSLQRCDVLVSNPPYISREVWTYGQGQMGYSVRKYEPKLALVPGDTAPAYDGCDHADVFYARLLDIGSRLRPRVLLFEVGDEEQALRVVKLVRRNDFTRHASCEIWRDWPDLPPEEEEAESFNTIWASGY
ncbi:HemK family methyltransferase [Colletotrichum orchidophilum]|uniref:peptide chain release factor N(5)-glutamine methyltransferase n=1 Tax=Colletotrichum orchidophilum TaxID=1209926 RepID=A0A1G4B256_9PEZI|nr:HemK family methyltransferase [Colletotrichum orchidophilum]OHE95433.1 HemK family methyltransferase [Colletotrichum orchidophilum]